MLYNCSSLRYASSPTPNLCYACGSLWLWEDKLLLLCLAFCHSFLPPPSLLAPLQCVVQREANVKEGCVFLVKQVLQPMGFVWGFLWSHLAESEMKRDSLFCAGISHAVWRKCSGDPASDMALWKRCLKKKKNLLETLITWLVILDENSLKIQQNIQNTDFRLS